MNHSSPDAAVVLKKMKNMYNDTLLLLIFSKYHLESNLETPSDVNVGMDPW
jgi:hypothetical protein